MQNLDKSIIKRNFSKAASSYESNAILQKTIAKNLIERCNNFNGKILDIGAGPGIIRKISGWENIVELDLSYKMCKESGGVAVNADAENLPFKAQIFDNIISSCSLQWVNDLKQTFEGINHVLKPGGSFAFTTFGPNSLKQLRDSYAYLSVEPQILNFTPAIKIYAALKKAGFKNVVIEAQKHQQSYPDILTALQSIKKNWGKL